MARAFQQSQLRNRSMTLCPEHSGPKRIWKKGKEKINKRNAARASAKQGEGSSEEDVFNAIGIRVDGSVSSSKPRKQIMPTTMKSPRKNSRGKRTAALPVNQSPGDDGLGWKDRASKRRLLSQVDALKGDIQEKQEWFKDASFVRKLTTSHLVKLATRIDSFLSGKLFDDLLRHRGSGLMTEEGLELRTELRETKCIVELMVEVVKCFIWFAAPDRDNIKDNYAVEPSVQDFRAACLRLQDSGALSVNVVILRSLVKTEVEAFTASGKKQELPTILNIPFPELQDDVLDSLQIEGVRVALAPLCWSKEDSAEDVVSTLKALQQTQFKRNDHQNALESLISLFSDCSHLPLEGCDQLKRACKADEPILQHVVNTPLGLHRLSLLDDQVKDFKVNAVFQVHVEDALAICRHQKPDMEMAIRAKRKFAEIDAHASQLFKRNNAADIAEIAEFLDTQVLDMFSNKVTQFDDDLGNIVGGLLLVGNTTEAPLAVDRLKDAVDTFEKGLLSLSCHLDLPDLTKVGGANEQEDWKAHVVKCGSFLGNIACVGRLLTNAARVKAGYEEKVETGVDNQAPSPSMI